MDTEIDLDKREVELIRKEADCFIELNYYYKLLKILEGS